MDRDHLCTKAPHHQSAIEPVEAMCRASSHAQVLLFTSSQLNS